MFTIHTIIFTVKTQLKGTKWSLPFFFLSQEGFAPPENAEFEEQDEY